jgi:GT2 family glycosyltransferase
VTSSSEINKLPQKKASISILIITYNRPEDLLEFLESLKIQQNVELFLEEVLVLDNASTVSYEKVRDLIRQNPQLKVNFIESEENLGVSRGRNKVMGMAKGDWLLVLDDDIVFSQPDDFEKLAQLPFRDEFRDNNTVMISPRIIYYDTGDVQVTAFPHKKYDKYKDKHSFLTAYFIGAAHLIKKDILAATGVYPLDFFYGMEEYDLSYRVLDTGATIAYDASVTLRHKESPLGRQPNYKKLQMQWINKSKVAWRYLPLIYFFSTALLWSFQYLKSSYRHPLTYLKAWLSIMAIPFTEKRRTVGQKTLDYLHRVEARLWY